MDFTRPERCRRQRTGREDRRSNFYEIPDNLAGGNQRQSAMPRDARRLSPTRPSSARPRPGCRPDPDRGARYARHRLTVTPGPPSRSSTTSGTSSRTSLSWSTVLAGGRMASADADGRGEQLLRRRQEGSQATPSPSRSRSKRSWPTTWTSPCTSDGRRCRPRGRNRRPPRPGMHPRSGGHSRRWPQLLRWPMMSAAAARAAAAWCSSARPGSASPAQVDGDHRPRSWSRARVARARKRLA